MASASPENIASEKQRRLRKQDKEGNYGERKKYETENAGGTEAALTSASRSDPSFTTLKPRGELIRRRQTNCGLSSRNFGTRHPIRYRALKGTLSDHAGTHGIAG